MERVLDIDFEHSVGFLVSDIARLMRVQFNEEAQSLGLTLAQSRALIHLARNEGINQKSLAAMLEIQPITLLRQLDRLEENGLVERRPDPADRRMQRLFLTPAASPLLDQLTQLGRAMTERAFEGVAEAEREQATSVLQIVKQNLIDVTHPEADEGDSKNQGQASDV
ncbi:MAG: MarR family transcriptional regulator [Proteobacteria bacterium]|nr:MarR family transcriptional regulator [Pseudomonadota bacterium]